MPHTFTPDAFRALQRTLRNAITALDSLPKGVPIILETAPAGNIAMGGGKSALVPRPVHGDQTGTLLALGFIPSIPGNGPGSSMLDTLCAERDRLKADLEAERAAFAEFRDAADRQCHQLHAENAALQRTVDKLRTCAAIPAPTQAPAPVLSPAQPVSVALRFEAGQQTRALRDAGVTLDDVRRLFAWHFADRRDPSQGGYWKSRPGMEAQAKSLADRIFGNDGHNPQADAFHDRIDRE